MRLSQWIMDYQITIAQTQSQYSLNFVISLNMSTPTNFTTSYQIRLLGDNIPCQTRGIFQHLTLAILLKTLQLTRRQIVQ